MSPDNTPPVASANIATAPNLAGLSNVAVRLLGTERVTRLVFRVSAALTVILAVAMAVAKGWHHGLGALEGGGIVVGDVAIFMWFLRKVMSGPLTTPIWKTIVKFYLISLVNIIVCVLIIKFGLGAPLAFVAGLGLFLPALILGLLFSLFGKPPAGPAQADRAETGPPSDA
ncbi:MAG: hypothetical protein LBF58_08995 [Deltaproteobacteria bacterium]|jgi:hypothetical protein|nr:hypothetical protein [Deltaproteobacteria bacterium]